MKKLILVLALVSLLFTGCTSIPSHAENQQEENTVSEVVNESEVGGYVDLTTMDSYLYEDEYAGYSDEEICELHKELEVYTGDKNDYLKLICTICGKTLYQPK